MQWHFSRKCLPSFYFWHEENKGFPTPERISMKYAHQSPCKESLCHRIVLTWRSRRWMNRMVCSLLIALFQRAHIVSGSSFGLDVPVGLWPWVRQQSKSQGCGEAMSACSAGLLPSLFEDCAPFGFSGWALVSTCLFLSPWAWPSSSFQLSQWSSNVVAGLVVSDMQVLGFYLIYWTSISKDSAGACVFISIPGDSDACSSGNLCFIKRAC